MKSQSEDICVLGISLTNPPLRLRQKIRVHIPFYDGHRERSRRQQHGILGKPPGSSEFYRVFLNLAKRERGSEDLLNSQVPEDQLGASSQHRREQDVSVRDESHAGSSAMT